MNQSIPDILHLENWIFEGLIMTHEKYEKEFYTGIAEIFKGIKK